MAEKKVSKEHKARGHSAIAQSHADLAEVITQTVRLWRKYGLMIKTLFFTGARVDEFIHFKVEDLHFESDPPQIHITRAKGQSSRYVPILPSLASAPFPCLLLEKGSIQVSCWHKTADATTPCNGGEGETVIPPSEIAKRTFRLNSSRNCRRRSPVGLSPEVAASLT